MATVPQDVNASSDHGSGDVTDAGAASAFTPGMNMVREAVKGTTAAVLNPTAGLTAANELGGMDVGANALADSAATMMLQDMRSYLQSTEAILLPVAAAAFAKMLEDQPSGQKTLDAIAEMLAHLTKFSADAIANAAKIKQSFG